MQSDMEHELPPNNREAERSVLGSLLRDNSQMADVVRQLKPEHFYSDAHQRIFAAMLRMFDKGTPIDAVTLADALNGAGDLQDAGGYGYIVELHDAAPAAWNGSHYAEIVVDKFQRRTLMRLCEEFRRRSVDPAELTEQVLAEAERRVFAICNGRGVGEPLHVSVIMRKAFDTIVARSRGDRDVIGLPSGWHELDSLTGGFHGGELCIVAARPGEGKTALAVSVALHLARENVGWLMFSLEQRPVELGERMICAHASVNSHRTRKGSVTADDVAAMLGACDDSESFSGRISEIANATVRMIVAETRRVHSRDGIKLVIIDYLQLIVPEDSRVIRTEQIATITRQLKLLARELGIAIICLCQINRDSERDNRRPRLSDLRESGAIEQDADTVMFCFNPDRENKSSTLRQIIVGKQRNGPTGDVPLHFRGEYIRFDNAVPDTPAEWK